MYKDIICRLDRLDQYIREKATGTPKQLSAKLDISERQVRGYIKLLKDLGAPVRYSRRRSTYYYIKPGTFNFNFRLENRVEFGNRVFLGSAGSLPGRPELAKTGSGRM